MATIGDCLFYAPTILRGDEAFVAQFGGRYVPRDEDRVDRNTPLPGERLVDFIRRRRAGQTTTGSR